MKKKIRPEQFLVIGDPHWTNHPEDAYRWDILSVLRARATAEETKALVILGDGTDSKDRHPAPLVHRIVSELVTFPCPVWWVMGNHDYIDEDQPFFGFLDGLKGVHFVKEPGYGMIGKTRCLFLPHSRDPMRDWRKFRKADIATQDLVLMHQTVHGAEASNGERLEGLSVPYLTKTFGKVPIISGDVHVPQKIGPVTYVGSPHPIHFGDSFHPRYLRVIHGKALTIEPVYRTTISRKTYIVEDVGELKTLHEKDALQKGDQVKVAVSLARRDFGDWEEKKQEIRAYLSSIEVESFGISLRPKEEAVRVRLKASQADRSPIQETRDLEKVIGRYLEREGGKVSKRSRLLGIKIAKQAAEAVGFRTSISSGDLVFQDLTVQGFRSYGKKQTIEFPRTKDVAPRSIPGLFHLTGENKTSPQAGANGTGKSSLWDALTWVLYGKTARDLFGPIVCNWNSEEVCSVSVRFAKAGITYVVTRTQDPNSLTLHGPGSDPRVVTQAEITDLLGLGQEQFLFSVLMGQFSDFFFDLSAAEKLRVFSDALDLSLWASASKMAGAAEKEFSQRAMGFLADGMKCESREQEIRKQITTLKVEEEKARKERSHRRSSLLQDLKVAKRKMRRLTVKVERAWKRGEIARTTLEEAEKSIRTYRSREINLAANLHRARTEEATATESLVETRAAIARLEKGKCPVCSKPMPREVIARERKPLDAKAKRLGKELETLATRISGLVHGGRVAVRRRKRLQKTLPELKAAAQRAEGIHDQRKSALLAVTSRKDSIAAEIHALADASTSFAKMLKKQRAGLRLVRKDRRRFARLQKREDRKIAHAAWWVKAFRDLRLWLIEEAILELEIEANNALAPLGLDGWRVLFDVERETKSGTISRGFQVFVQAPDSPKSVPWKAWCGGETQKLRVAGALGFAGLIARRRGIHSNLEVWDEPTAHLSPEGVRDMIAFFGARARSEKRQLWLVDHNRIAAGGFDGEVCAVLGETGTTLVRRYLRDGE